MSYLEPTPPVEIGRKIMCFGLLGFFGGGGGAQGLCHLNICPVRGAAGLPEMHDCELETGQM